MIGLMSMRDNNMATVDQFIAAFGTHSIYLERLSSQLGNQAVPYLDKIDSEITKLFNNLPKRNLSQEQQAAIRKQVRDITNENISAMIKEMQLEHKDLGYNEARFMDKTINAEIESEINTVTPSAAQVNRAAKEAIIHVGGGSYTTYKKMFSDYKRGVSERIDGVVLNGFVNGKTNRGIADLILQDLPSTMKNAESKARTIARTGTNHYSNQARLAYEQENDNVIVDWISVSVLDSRTSQQCAALDDVRMKKSDPRWVNFVPPSHPNCRRSIVPGINPKLKYDDSSAQRPTNFKVDGKKEPKRVNSKRSYYDELSKLSARDQDAVLGPTLGKAFRKLDDPDAFARQTINQATFEPLTIKEMEKKNNELGKILQKYK